jgi:branched-chain amino acid transport system ATP-binding protein
MLLTVDNLHVSYGAVHAVQGVSLHVAPGEIVALIGSNGAGKTTLLRAVSGLVRPSAGSIVFDGGQRLDRLPAHAIVRAGVSHVPEGRQVFGNLTVRENLELGAYQRRDRAASRATLARVFELFPVLKERLPQSGSTLSGGEQQMLAIGRALMAQPRLLLLDEPSLGLAPLVVQTIFAIVREINSAGTTILLVEQNAHMALRIANRGYVLQTGTVVLEDSGANLLASPEVRGAYLGE